MLVICCYQMETIPLPESYLPTTVVAAIVLFIAREFLEAYRRHGVNERRLQGIKVLLASELERNKWVFKSILHLISNFEGAFELDLDFQLKEDAGGRLAYFFGDDDHFHSVGKIWPIQMEKLEASLDISAELDGELFQLSLLSLDALKEMKHVQQSLLEFFGDEPPNPKVSKEVMFEGFSEYAAKEIEDAEKELSRLYLFCTGNRFENFRLR